MITSNVQSCRPYGATNLRKVDNKQNSVANNKQSFAGKVIKMKPYRDSEDKFEFLKIFGIAALITGAAGLVGIGINSLLPEKVNNQKKAELFANQELKRKADSTYQAEVGKQLNIIEKAKMSKAAKAVEHVKR